MTNKTTLKTTTIIAVLAFATFFVATGAYSMFNSNSITNNLVFAQMQPKIFDAKLTGKDEVPSKVTKATGTAHVIAVNGNTISYTVNVKDMQKVTEAHIHQGKAGVNGPVVVTLFKTTHPSATTSGTLAKGTITSANLEGPLAGKKITDLVSLLKSGNAYVNVHTEANPKGEIRGQLSAM